MRKRDYLAATGYSEVWDFNSRILLLGPWCLANQSNRKKLAGTEYLMVPSPWRPVQKIKEADEYCNLIYNKLIEKLTDSLNLIHNVSYPKVYWDVLLGPWLMHFIHTFYDRYRRMENATQLYPDFFTHVLKKEEIILAPKDTLDFVGYLINDDLYNLNLYSLISYRLFPEKIDVVSNQVKTEVKPNQGINNFRNGNFKVRKLFRKNYIVLTDMYHLRPIDFLSLQLKYKGFILKHLRFPEIDNYAANINLELRQSISFNEGSDRFQLLLNEVISSAIPVCFLENYKLFKHNYESSDVYKAIGSAIGWYFNEPFKFFAAHAATKGAKLIEFQSGGGYGFSQTVPTERISRKKNIFYTWGWGSNENNTRILTSALLSKIINSYSRKNDQLFFIGTTVPKYVFRFQSTLLPDDFEKYLEDKMLFLRALSEEIRCKVIYRSHPHDFGWEENDVMRKAIPQIRFSNTGKAIDWIKKSKLVIIDHPHTSFLEALTINAPSVFYWDHRVYNMRSEAERYFQLLRDAGILYNDPLSAAKKVNEIIHDPRDWWFRPEVQKARSNFCSHFAYAKKDWINIWANEFKKLLDKNE